MIKILTALGGAFPLAAGAVTVTLWLAHLESTTADAAARVIELKTAQAEQEKRLDVIQENRATNLQRLARAEEAVSSIKDALTVINAKLDRVLMRR